MVVARPRGLLVDLEDVAGFGYRHRGLRELGGGWQLLETTGWNDPPDLRAPCRALAAATGSPVLAAYISDGDCAVMCAATPAAVGSLTHLWEVGGACGGRYQHQPDGMPGPTDRGLDDVVAELTAWSASAGLRPAPSALGAILTHDGDADWRSADDLVFDLVKALGVERIGRRLPWAFAVDGWPFSLITGFAGLALRARSRALFRRADEEDGEVPAAAQPWEAAAIALEEDLWASLYRAEADVPALVRRIAEVNAAYDATRGSRSAPPSVLSARGDGDDRPAG
ncbi:hypothetical protein ACIBSW_18815 [Actinoplanes sp. NPDC049668]|uniref:hypothetical protein n=1 Tax=unclassified Actinoplanes TaxID=2626549 RepID=UPI0033AA78D0